MHHNIIVYITFLLFGTSATSLETVRSRIRLSCQVLSPCNIVNTVNECSSCGMTCIASKSSSPGYCFPDFGKDQIEDASKTYDFQYSMNDDFKIDGKRDVQDYMEDDLNGKGSAQYSLE